MARLGSSNNFLSQSWVATDRLTLLLTSTGTNSPQVSVLIYRASTARLTTDTPFAGGQIFAYLTWPPQLNDHGREHLTVARTGWGTL